MLSPLLIRLYFYDAYLAAWGQHLDPEDLALAHAQGLDAENLAPGLLLHAIHGFLRAYFSGVRLRSAHSEGRDRNHDEQLSTKLGCEHFNLDGREDGRWNGVDAAVSTARIEFNLNLATAPAGS
ncbi:MAG: hypothetical protein R3F00_04585 [Dokdonella sp.]